MWRARKDVEEVVRAARRRLFELETLQHGREIREGKANIYDSIDDFWARRRSRRA